MVAVLVANRSRRELTEVKCKLTRKWKVKDVDESPPICTKNITLFFQVRQNKGIRWPCYYSPGNLALLSMELPKLLGALFYYVDTFWPPSYPKLTIVKELLYCYFKGKIPLMFSVWPMNLNELENEKGKM